MVVKLKDDCGMWIDNSKDIASKFIIDYSARFKSNHTSTQNFTNIQLQQIITDSDNSKLVKLPDKEEVRQALFAIDSNKTPGPNGLVQVFLSITGN